MKILIIVIYIVSIGLMYISGTNRMKGIGEVPLIYKHPIISLILNLGIIIVIITAIGMFFFIDWKVSISIIIISLFTQKIWAKLVNIIIIYPLARMLY